MSEPWIRYRNIPILFGMPIWWPVGVRGWLFFLVLAIMWIGGANVISLTIMPGKPFIAWSAIIALALVVLFLFQLVLRVRGERV